MRQEAAGITPLFGHEKKDAKMKHLHRRGVLTKPLATEAADKIVTIAAENFMVGLWILRSMTEGTTPGDVASLVEVGLASKAEESRQETSSHACFR